MKNQKGSIKVSNILAIIIIVIILIFGYNAYKKNFFNGFEKAISVWGATTNFTRDSKVKYSKEISYKIENIDFNDATIYKEVKLEKDTPYRISCMVKTEDVVCQEENQEGGVQIGLLETTEYSIPIKGTNDWQQIEFMFDSKDMEKAKISFRLGGNENNCKGKVWFSDFKLEKGIKNSNSEWNMACFIIKEVDVNIEGKRYNFVTNSTDIENVKLNMERFKDDCYNFSLKKMSVNYDVIEIDKPAKTISYSEDHGYYFSDKDVKDLIFEQVKNNEYDHIFVVCRMEDEDGKNAIPIENNWIGLGGMEMDGKGYSLIRISKNGNKSTYKYGITNQAPEEVFLHEFLHTLERNLKERNHYIPELHDYEKYEYTENVVDGLNQWYKDYMSKSIYDEKIGEYIGLDECCYTTQPISKKNFVHALEINFNDEPKNIIEEILAFSKAF